MAASRGGSSGAASSAIDLWQLLVSAVSGAFSRGVCGGSHRLLPAALLLATLGTVPDLARVLMPHLSLERYHDSYSLVTIMPSREHWCGMTRALFAGQMTIFRNDPATNSLFKSITGEHDWQKDFKNPGFSRMDEIYLEVPLAAIMNKDSGWRDDVLVAWHMR